MTEGTGATRNVRLPLKEDSRRQADARSRTRWRSYGRSLRLKKMAGAEIRVSPFELPSGEATAVVAVVCPDFDCFVSLPRLGGLQRSPKNVRSAND